MKLFLVIGFLLICGICAQKPPVPTKPPTRAPIPSSNTTKRAITCDNIMSYPPSTCCESFPSIESKEIIDCSAQCMKQDQVTPTCCMSNCTLKKINGVNSDNSFNEDAIAKFLASISKSSDKNAYTEFVKSSVKSCKTSVPVSQTSCIWEDLVFCTLRKLYLNCPDKKNNSLCNDIDDVAKKCTGYPLAPKRDTPKAGVKGGPHKENGNGKKNGTKDNYGTEKKGTPDGKNENHKNGLKKNSKKNSTAVEKPKNAKGSDVGGKGDKPLDNRPKNETKPEVSKNSTKVTEKPVSRNTTKSANNTNVTNTTPKNQGLTFPVNRNESTSKKSTNTGKASQVKGVRLTTTAPTANEKTSTHRSQSNDGALGAKGPRFGE